MKNQPIIIIIILWHFEFEAVTIGNIYHWEHNGSSYRYLKSDLKDSICFSINLQDSATLLLFVDELIKAYEEDKNNITKLYIGIHSDKSFNSSSVYDFKKRLISSVPSYLKEECKVMLFGQGSTDQNGSEDSIGIYDIINQIRQYHGILKK